MIRYNTVFQSLIANRLYSIAKEMGQNMVKTSFSRIFQDARDLSTSIHYPEGDILLQIPYIPVLAGTPYFALISILKYYGEDVNNGDVFILGDPFYGNNHQPDITVLKPVFFRRKLKFWVISKGHHADIGGSSVVAYNPRASTLWEEGIRILPAKLFESGEINREIWDFILANVKLKRTVKNDLNCQVGAVNIGERRLLELLERYGENKIKKATDGILNSTLEFTKKEMEKLPIGEYYACRTIDIRNTPENELSGKSEVKIAIKTKITGKKVIFDFEDTDDQVKAFINSPYPNTFASCLAAFCFIINPGPSINQGIMKLLEVRAPKGSLVNPEPPFPSVASTVDTSSAIIEAIWLSLSEAIPERISACWSRWCAPTTIGIDPKTGKNFSEVHFLSKGGGGAVYGNDGWNHIGLVICGGGLRSPDPEIHERVTPFLLSCHEYLKDSAGPGKWRGGFGVVYRWKVDGDNIPCAMFGSGIMEDTAPSGLKGGKRAPPYVLKIIRSDGTVIDADTNTFYTIYKGDIVEIYSSGGGGFGDPFEREPEKVLEDVRNELISIESAERDYGVVINPDTLEIDWERTEQLRVGRFSHNYND